MTTPSKNTQNIESWATPFRKVLDLEVANGYSNKAVVGGLDRFVLHWIEPMAEFLSDPNLASFCRTCSAAPLSSTSEPWKLTGKSATIGVRAKTYGTWHWRWKDWAKSQVP